MDPELTVPDKGFDVETSPGSPQRLVPPDRKLVILLVLLIDVSAVTASLAGTGGAMRMVLGLAFALSVPGWALVGLLRLSWPAAEVGLTTASSLALVMATAQVMLWAHAWNPILGQLLLGLAAAPVLVWQLTAPGRVGVHGMPKGQP